MDEAERRAADAVVAAEAADLEAKSLRDTNEELLSFMTELEAASVEASAEGEAMAAQMEQLRAELMQASAPPPSPPPPLGGGWGWGGGAPTLGLKLPPTRRRDGRRTPGGGGGGDRRAGCGGASGETGRNVAEDRPKTRPNRATRRRRTVAAAAAGFSLKSLLSTVGSRKDKAAAEVDAAGIRKREDWGTRHPSETSRLRPRGDALSAEKRRRIGEDGENGRKRGGRDGREGRGKVSARKRRATRDASYDL